MRANNRGITGKLVIPVNVELPNSIMQLMMKFHRKERQTEVIINLGVMGVTSYPRLSPLKRLADGKCAPYGQSEYQ